MLSYQNTTIKDIAFLLALASIRKLTVTFKMSQNNSRCRGQGCGQPNLCERKKKLGVKCTLTIVAFLLALAHKSDFPLGTLFESLQEPLKLSHNI